ncbi:helix-turn-helix transcriptional regulator [Lactobacillus sp. ESL0701]|uniref:helix-turn-helix domain-containing protein n=1 Tax=Lactobacillus sp. ESL0701 TaxID=2983217 RepID=UPI0023F757AC|nr:helix-turn-helix transcriptional regulator [Lactobacillus sp. ESL0701]MDF7671719.1 helix-turn-helix transcriptional regulator [Lactobacillus sp. ESL0701]
MKFGEHLKQARITRHLTQEEVAEDFFVSRQTISSWENEKTYPDMSSLIKLSDYYQISLDTLLKEDSGMREYLEKKNVAQELKNIKKYLELIDSIILIVCLAEMLDIIKLHGFFLLLILIQIPLVKAIRHINDFNNLNNLGIESKYHQFFKKHGWLEYLIFIIIPLMQLCANLLHDPQSDHLMDIIGAIIEILILWLFAYIFNKKHNY